MRTLKKLTMTLALLIMAVGGAWAANTYTITFAANGNTKTVENVTLPKTFQCSWENADGELDLILKELYGWSWSGNSNQTFCDPNNIPESSDKNKVVAGNDNGNHYITINNVFEGTATITGTFVVNNNGDKPYSLDISIVAIPPTEWDLTSQDGKNWTLDKMPASNIELQVEYFAESNLFLSKNALADKTNIAVTAGDLGVQFGNDGKSANTITEGTPMTVKYNGSKKVIGVKAEKKAAAKPVTLATALEDGAIIKVYFKWRNKNNGDYVQGVYNAASGTFTASKGGGIWAGDGRAVYKVEKSGDNIIIGAGFSDYNVEGMVWTFNTTNDTYTTTNGSEVNQFPKEYGLISVSVNDTDITSTLSELK